MTTQQQTARVAHENDPRGKKTELTGRQAAVLVAIRDLAIAGGYCPDIKSLSMFCNITDALARRYVAVLCRKGYIVKIYNRPDRPQYYSLRFLCAPDNVDQIAAGNRNKRQRRGSWNFERQPSGRPAALISREEEARLYNGARYDDYRGREVLDNRIVRAEGARSLIGNMYAQY